MGRWEMAEQQPVHCQYESRPSEETPDLIPCDLGLPLSPIGHLPFAIGPMNVIS